MNVRLEGHRGSRKEKLAGKLIMLFEKLIPKGTKRIGMTADEFTKKIKKYAVDDRRLIRHFARSDNKWKTFLPVLNLDSHCFFREMLKVLISSINEIGGEEWEGEPVSEEEQVIVTEKLLRGYQDGTIWEIEGIPYERFRGVHKRILNLSIKLLEGFAVSRLIAAILLNYGLRKDIEYPTNIKFAEEFFSLQEPIEPDALDILIAFTSENLASNLFGYSLLRSVKVTDEFTEVFLDPSVELYFILVRMLEKWMEKNGDEYISLEVSTSMQLQVFRMAVANQVLTDKEMSPIGEFYEERTRELLDAALAIPDK